MHLPLECWTASRTPQELAHGGLIAIAPGSECASVLRHVQPGRSDGTVRYSEWPDARIFFAKCLVSHDRLSHWPHEEPRDFLCHEAADLYYAGEDASDDCGRKGLKINSRAPRRASESKAKLSTKASSVRCTMRHPLPRPRHEVGTVGVRCVASIKASVAHCVGHLGDNNIDLGLSPKCQSCREARPDGA